MLEIKTIKQYTCNHCKNYSPIIDSDFVPYRTVKNKKDFHLCPKCEKYFLDLYQMCGVGGEVTSLIEDEQRNIKLGEIYTIKEIIKHDKEVSDADKQVEIDKGISVSVGNGWKALLLLGEYDYA